MLLSSFFPASRVCLLALVGGLAGVGACVRKDKAQPVASNQSTQATNQSNTVEAPIPGASTGSQPDATPNLQTPMPNPGDFASASPTPGETAGAMPTPATNEPQTSGNGFGVKDSRSTEAASNVGDFALASLVGANGEGIQGQVRFLTGSQDGTQAVVQIIATVAGVPAGDHGIHIHETGDCSNFAQGSAGGHWNPGNKTHGGPSSGDRRHIGDLGNITVNKEGVGTLTGQMAALTGSIIDVKQALIGRAVVLHGGADDLSSQPAGNSGTPIACGIIRAAGPEGMAH